MWSMPESISLPQKSLEKIKWHEKMPETASLYEECIGSTIEDLANEIQSLACGVTENVQVSFRVKDPETLQKKIQLKNPQSIFSIDDVYGIRILVDSVEDVYRVLEKIWQNFTGYVDHDYIKEPKISTSELYKGKKLQLVQFIAYKNEMPFEIQITTTTFHKDNEPMHAGYHYRKYHS